MYALVPGMGFRPVSIGSPSHQSASVFNEPHREDRRPQILCVSCYWCVLMSQSPRARLNMTFILHCRRQEFFASFIFAFISPPYSSSLALCSVLSRPLQNSITPPLPSLLLLLLLSPRLSWLFPQSQLHCCGFPLISDQKWNGITKCLETLALY